MSSLRSPWKSLGGYVWIGVVGFFLCCYLLGRANPFISQPVRAEVLGPESGELVSHYLNRAADSFDESQSKSARWALVSLNAEVTPSEVTDLFGGVRVSQVLARVRIERVQTPVVSIAVPGSQESITRVLEEAARFTPIGTSGTRAAGVAEVTRHRLEQGCACIAALVVRGTFSALHTLRELAQVRAVELLPEGADGSRIGVSPLLPEYQSTVLPLSDDGQVPGN